MRKWDRVTSAELLTIIEYLKCNFDPVLSGRLIELFHERMQDDEHVDPDALHALMKHVFALMTEGRSADQAFGLKPIKGKYNRTDNYERDRTAAAIVTWLVRKGVTWENAVSDASEQLNIGHRTVERAFITYREGLECMPDEQLSLIADTPLPQV